MNSERDDLPLPQLEEKEQMSKRGKLAAFALVLIAACAVGYVVWQIYVALTIYSWRGKP